jgi:hypothetical protein
MPRWFNTPLQLRRRWTINKNQSQHHNKKRVGGRYILLNEIGHGASGIVHLAVDVNTNARYVCVYLNCI